MVKDGWGEGLFVDGALGEREGRKGREEIYTSAVLGRVVVFMYLSCEDARTYEKIFMIPSYKSSILFYLVNTD